MRHFLRTAIIALVMVLTVLPMAAQGQIKITTKKDKISDFTSKTTKVVLSGNSMADEFLKSAMASCWRISPYEFCSKDEFDALKTKDDYYFLMTVAGQNKKESEPGITFLTLVKGGDEAKTSLDAMTEVVSMPYCSSRFASGREITYLPALLDIMQDFTQKAMKADLKGYTGLTYYNTQLSKSKTKDIIFSEDDLASDVTDDVKSKNFKKGMRIEDEDMTDEIFDNADEQALVTYTVYPSEAMEGSVCYKMLIDVNNHDLYYFRKHKISGKTGPGFTADDIKKIAATRPGK